MRNKKDYLKEYEDFYKDIVYCNKYDCVDKITDEYYFILNINSYIYYDFCFSWLGQYKNISYNETINDHQAMVGLSICNKCLDELTYHLDKEKINYNLNYEVVPKDKVYIYKLLG